MARLTRNVGWRYRVAAVGPSTRRDGYRLSCCARHGRQQPHIRSSRRHLQLATRHVRLAAVGSPRHRQSANDSRVHRYNRYRQVPLHRRQQVRLHYRTLGIGRDIQGRIAVARDRSDDSVHGHIRSGNVARGARATRPVSSPHRHSGERRWTLLRTQRVRHVSRRTVWIADSGYGAVRH